MKRRVFLQKSTAGLGVLAGWPLTSEGRGTASPAVVAPPIGQNPPPDNYQVPDWLRYSRSVYFEGYCPPVWPSLKDFDAKRIVDLTVGIGGNVLRFQPITYRALYPTKLFPVYPELGSRDLIDEISRECRRAGIHHYSYCILAGGWDRAFANDPRFSAYMLLDADGKPSREGGTGYGNVEQIMTCGTGDAYRQMIRKLVAEICAHDTDGVYFDAPSGYRSVCFCDNCRENFKKFSGMDLDRLRNVHGLARLPENADMKALVAWYNWANKLTEEDLVDIRKIIHGSGKFMLCHNGATWRPGSFHTQYRYSDGFMVEYSEQFYQRLLRAMMGSSMARPTKKLAQTYMGSYDVSANGEPAHTRPWAAHCVNLEDGDEIRMEGFADLAGGNMPLYNSVNRLLYGIGEGSTEPVKEVFALMRRAEPIFKDSVPVSDLSIVPTAESLELWRGKGRSWNMMMSEGLALAMLDERISFDVNPNTEMTAEWLKTQKAIVLCGASAITDQDAALLAAWVKDGGSLLATYDSGLYDGNGELRHDGGALRDILGVDMKGEAPGGHTDTFYRITKSHPALGEYHEGKMVMGDSKLIPITVRPGATVLAEGFNIDFQKNLGPAIVVNQYGRGRVVYVAGSLEAQYIASRVISLQKMLVSMVRWLRADAPMPFSLAAPRGVYGILRRATSGDLVFWICANVGYKDDTVGRMRQDFLPVPNVVARVLIPEGRQLKSVDLLRAKQPLPFSMEGGYAVINLPTVHIAEVVHMSFA
jgi:hypothetical protein